MLQKAASNAYSWWWASHIRTKQSKWLEQNLQDMEGKVQAVLKLIEEDGDSFAKRAEMYYEKRPELINFVEESYRAYRALAERYDHMSTELQNANNTLATVCPERVQLPTDDEEDNDVTKPSSRKKKLKAKKSPKKAANSDKAVFKSGMSESEALLEIDKLQKEILALQTVKEFVKSSYESGLNKYWEIETRIAEIQERVFNLQDEFQMGKLIEDDEARALMAGAALKSCEETLVKLREKQERSKEEVRAEFKRVEDAREKLNSLKHKFLPQNPNDEENESAKGGEGELGRLARESDELREKIAEHFDSGAKENLSVTKLAEKIDELVGKVISLETSVSSQTVPLDRLRTETDDLQAQIRTLEDEKATLIDGSNSLTNRLKEMEEKFKSLQELNQDLENQNHHLQAHFTEARCSLDHLTEKLHTVKFDEEESELGGREHYPSPDSDLFSVKREDPNSLEKVEKQGVTVSQTAENVMISHENMMINNEPWGEEKKKYDEMNWREMLLNGLEDKETVLLTEYITILRNYKDLRKKLSDVERQNRDRMFETTVQMRELRSLITKRDREIQFLRQKLNDNEYLNVDSCEISVLFESPRANNKEEEEDEKFILMDEPRTISLTEEKLRMNIDALLDKNLDFWLRFSSSFHQIQKFKSEFQDLQSEIAEIQEKEKLNQEGNAKTERKSALRPIYKHLMEIQTELSLWIEKSAVLKDELQRRFTSLSEIEEEITKALKADAEEEEMKFTSHEAAKLQGEVSNMKQENNKVRDELEAGWDHVITFRQELAKIIRKLNNEFELSRSKGGDQKRPRVPLRSFIFGTKPKKKSSIFFSFMHRRKNHGLRAGMQM